MAVNAVSAAIAASASSAGWIQPKVFQAAVARRRIDPFRPADWTARYEEWLRVALFPWQLRFRRLMLLPVPPVPPAPIVSHAYGNAFVESGRESGRTIAKPSPSL